MKECPESAMQRTISILARCSTEVVKMFLRCVLLILAMIGNAGAQTPTGSAKAGDAATVNLGGTVMLDLVWVPAGGFLMGSPETEVGRDKNEGPQHEVTHRKGFWMGRHLVTQNQWESVMGANPSHFKWAMLPVETVSWNDCQEFLQKLNTKYAVAKFEFRLPTEAQWEYACRAGTTTPFYFGNDLDSSMANIDGERPYGNGAKGENRKTTTPVGTFKANAWGLDDMHGNLGQWCLDGINGYRKEAVIDPINPPGHPVLRGGSWAEDSVKCRSAKRWRDPVATKKDKIGFRVVLIEQ